MEKALMKKQPELWIGLVGLKPLKRPPSAPAGAFTNIITWATDKREFREKVETIAAELEMYVVEIEDEEPVTARLRNSSVAEDIEDLIEHAKSNPKAILYGTFHTYPHDDA
jgi:hypothetical protein